MNTTIAFQLGDGVFWLSLAIGLLGLLIVAGVVAFAVWLKKQDQLVLSQQPSDANTRHQLITYYLENRSEFWLAYGQIILAILLIVVLTILLLTKTISPDAGLPILSAIAGFAIAKSANTARLGTTTTKEPPQSSQASSPVPQGGDSPTEFPKEPAALRNSPDNPGQSPTQDTQKPSPKIKILDGSEGQQIADIDGVHLDVRK